MEKSQTTLVKLSLTVVNPGAKGIAILSSSFCNISITADEVRKLYYQVLGLKMGDKRPLIEIVQSSKGLIDVDVPEDVLRVEFILNKRVQNENRNNQTKEKGTETN